jgi:bifunctional DNA-binding transcriptional regulator/antitoxin component of YhaV-PrlF toxin-antitoxin module
MAEAQISSEGMVVIPSSILKALGLESGGTVEFIPDIEGMVMLIARNLSPQNLRGTLPKPNLDCSVDEMVELGIKRAVMARSGRN